MTRYILAAICSLVIFSSCHFFGGKRIYGNGNVRKEDRTGHGKFSAVEIGNAFELHLRQDSAYNVNIETDENLFQYITVSIDGDKVHIYSEHNYNLDPSNGHKVKVYVSAPIFKDIDASGACTVIGENVLSSEGAIGIGFSGASDGSLEVKVPKVSLELTGASSIDLSGQTKDFTVEGSGASHARCFQLLAENADVDVSGASNAEVFGSVRINATASGASEVKCKGKGNLTKSESGASSVQSVN